MLQFGPTEFEIDILEQVEAFIPEAEGGRESRRAKKLSRTLEAPIIRGFRVCEQEISANPWCLYSKFTTCALPTPKNRLPFRIPAGEMVPKKYFH